MTELSVSSEFYPKVWIYKAAAIFATLFAIFATIMGPLFLFDIIKSVNGKPGTTAGIPLSIMAFFLVLIAGYQWFNVAVRSSPLLRIRRDGIEIRRIGASSINIPHRLLMLIWLICSREGFKTETFLIPWNAISDVSIQGIPMMRSLSIRFARSNGEDLIVLQDAEFRDPLERIARSIEGFRGYPEARENLSAKMSSIVAFV